ncbi:hypothetical protein R1sor_018792 [Riccia sorocarpa]|uniref:Reverse transcriptase zinc-binding domain-containing protein n=1 Tax=Riccia sorocarpa TaxID=122646 RepID=A0ABD3IAP0_9MARC
MREKANASWGVSWDTQKWENLWKNLWKSVLFPRDKLWLWRVVNKGFFTLERASTFGVAEPRCTRCNQGTENIDHLFFGCMMVSGQWNKLENLHCRAVGKGNPSTSLIQLIGKAVKPENAALLVSSVILLRHVWRNRCKMVYEAKQQSIPTDIILQEASRMIRTIQSKYKSTAKLEKIQACSKEIAIMRRMSRIDAEAGRHPMERDTTAGTLNTSRQNTNAQDGDYTSPSQELQWDMMRELNLLGFIEMQVPPSLADTPDRTQVLALP